MPVTQNTSSAEASCSTRTLTLPLRAGMLLYPFMQLLLWTSGQMSHTKTMMTFNNLSLSCHCRSRNGHLLLGLCLQLRTADFLALKSLVSAGMYNLSLDRCFCLFQTPALSLGISASLQQLLDTLSKKLATAARP